MGIRTLWLAAASALAVGCSSGGGSGTPMALSGQWAVWMTFNNVEMGPFATCLSQSGSTLDGVGITGTVNGNSFTITNDDIAGMEVVFAGVAAGGGASGSLSITGANLTGTFRMQPFVPVGSLAMTGTVGAVSVTANGGVASGRREYSDVAHTQLENLEVGLDDGEVRVHLTFEAAGFGLGTLALGGAGVSATLSYETDAEVVDQTATGGSVTVTRYDGTGMAGTYTLQVAGGSVTGSFDVAWDLEAYVP